jgi:hypothetical protein
MPALTLLVAFLAAYSLTLLIVCDKITDRPRQWVLTRISGHGYAGYSGVVLGDGSTGSALYMCTCEDVFDTLGDLLEHVHDERQALAGSVPMSKRAALLYLFRCPWCAGFWVAWPVCWSAWCFGDRSWWFVPMAALASRGVTGALATYANPRS